MRTEGDAVDELGAPDGQVGSRASLDMNGRQVLSLGEDRVPVGPEEQRDLEVKAPVPVAQAPAGPRRESIEPLPLLAPVDWHGEHVERPQGHVRGREELEVVDEQDALSVVREIEVAGDSSVEGG